MSYSIYGQCIEGNCYDGHGTYTWSDGAVYEGDWKDDLRHGDGTMIYFNEEAKYVGEWINNKKHGQGVYYYGDGSRHEGAWKNAIQHGQGTEFNSKGRSIYEGFWQEGVFTIKKNNRVTKTYTRSTNN